MEMFVSRALQINMLDEDRIKRLHRKEESVGYIIPNWNIQSLFGIESIKDRYGLRSDPDILVDYGDFIKSQIRRLKLNSHEGEGFINSSNLEATHSFDWGIYHNSARIIWEPVTTNKKSNSRLKAIREAKENVEQRESKKEAAYDSNDY